jgi:hypothetical protein
MINPYQEKWESRSSIRTRPRKEIDFNQKGFFFPPDKQVLLLLPEVIALGEQTKSHLLLQTFYKYLNDIVSLEIKLINTACMHVIYGSLPVSYAKETKLSAYTVLIDEYYHVYVAYDMMSQLDQAFPHLIKPASQVSDAYHAVTIIREKLQPKYREIFETTLIKELVEFFNDEQVHPTIKHYVNDHMNDEARHYGFFYDLLVHTWNNIAEDYQEQIGQYLGDFVKLYLSINSDKNYNFEILNLLLHDKDRANSLIERIYQGFEISTEMPIVKNVLAILKRTHIMDCAFVKNGFVRQGLYLAT